MRLKEFVERFCAGEADVTVTIIPVSGAHRSRWVKLYLGKGQGDASQCRSRPALERYRSAALAQMICVYPSPQAGEIRLLAENDEKNITLLAAQIERGNLAGCLM